MRTYTNTLLLATCLVGGAAFAPAPTFSAKTGAATTTVSTTNTLSMASKGFGEKDEPVQKKKSEGQTKRDAESSKYDEIANTGGQEYSIYVRQFGSGDDSWFPCGAICVPRGGQVSDAVFANEEALKVAIVRTYPKLKGYEEEFEFGSNLKIYPDDPVDVAEKTGARPTGFSFGNW
eukprot:CAMPEP_0119006862 /NCGR_PEP_ID=MMETSP1176-20130426/2597_1 /TAXON_ID=265551 /ORGANISM="Synedropsis recta cf, Strain CCMP1620" /LENGTH=175 /DNA_ID=CAMNT_0006958879 /DNA_START=50 /DNA_END=574 /DNA_ORIENTATION=-